MSNPVIEKVRRSLGRTPQTPLGPRPDIYPSRQPDSVEAEIELFLQEVEKLSGVSRKIGPADLRAALAALVVWAVLLKFQWRAVFFVGVLLAPEINHAIDLSLPHVATLHALRAVRSWRQEQHIAFP